jgi:hypothetical protein
MSGVCKKTMAFYIPKDDYKFTSMESSRWRRNFVPSLP